MLREKLEQLSEEQLMKEDDAFLLIKEGQALRWTVNRSALIGDKVVFEFQPEDHYTKPVRLTLKSSHD